LRGIHVKKTFGGSCEIERSQPKGKGVRETDQQSLRSRHAREQRDEKANLGKEKTGKGKSHGKRAKG